jgi:hypothetical protein
MPHGAQFPTVKQEAAIVVVIIAAMLVSALGYEALVAGGGTSSTSRSSDSSFVTISSNTSSAGCEIHPGQPETDWTTYHGNNSRSADASGPTEGVQPSCVRPGWKSQALDGQVYAEPLVYHGVVVVATEKDLVYGLNLTSGGTIWVARLGTPVDGSSLLCGDINPTGITGTPVIDPVTGTVYVVAFMAPGAHYLVALDVRSGTTKFSVPADPPGAKPLVQQERSALSLGNGRVYIMYGGLAGDCGDYHGWVVGVDANGTGGMVSYEVPSQRGAGIWAPSGAALDFAGDLFVATGNGASTEAFDFSNTVIELSPSLQEVAHFAPTDWAQLNSGDTDLGSVGPMILGHGELFQVGKEGVGYLLNADALGGVGGQLFSGHVCSSAFGGTALAGSIVFVSCTDGLVALNTTSNSFSVLWRGPSYPAGPPIVTSSDVWVVDTSSGELFGYNVHNGSQIYSARTGSVTRFTTPSTAGGQVLVAAGDEVFSFQLG